jgi:hypothetical protein
VSAQEILIEEIKRQCEIEAPMDDLVADTWKKLGPAPDVD